jgi:hypothetical protein
MANKVPEIVLLVQAGKKCSEGKPAENKPAANSRVQTVKTSEENKPTAERATENDFSHLGGKLLLRLEPTTTTPEGEPTVEEKFRDAGVYGETGGVVLPAKKASN